MARCPQLILWENNVMWDLETVWTDFFFPTNKGPNYLQYSNSLNDTFILCFIQLFLSFVQNVLNTFLVINILNKNLFALFFIFYFFRIMIFDQLPRALIRSDRNTHLEPWREAECLRSALLGAAATWQSCCEGNCNKYYDSVTL